MLLKVLLSGVAVLSPQCYRLSAISCRDASDWSSVASFVIVVVGVDSMVGVLSPQQDSRVTRVTVVTL